jgi:acetolactate synthase I/II/III large subunit
MNGADALVAALAAGGIEVVTANPGTSEMHLVSALGRAPGMRSVLGLAEGVVTGMADGYARVTRRPAATLLHLGPGLANGLANLHNARRAATPVVNIVGEHATDHRHLDAPLTSDIQALAATVGTVRTATSTATLGAEVSAAVAEAGTAPGTIVSVVVPADLAWGAVEGDPAGVTPFDPTATGPAAADLDGASLDTAAAALRSGRSCTLLLAGWAATGRALELAGAIAAATGADLLVDTFVPRLDNGIGAVAVERLPYFGEMALARLEGSEHLVCVGGRAPVAFFGYPGRPGRLVPAGCAVHELGPARGVDPVVVLEALHDLVGAGGASPKRHDTPAVAPSGTGPVDALSLAAAVAATLPDDAIVVDEAVTGGFLCLPAAAGSAPHHWVQLTGGAIGFGLPCAAGAALAASGRRVVALQADGSAMYTLQALWTMARESLDVTVVMLSNRRYAILEHEVSRTGAGDPGPQGQRLLRLDDPAIDAVALATGFGVPAVRVAGTGELLDALRRAHATPGPQLIDVVL